MRELLEQQGQQQQPPVLRGRSRSRSEIPRLKRYQPESRCRPPSPRRRRKSSIELAQRHFGVLKKPAMRSCWYAFRFIRSEELHDEYGRDIFMYYRDNEEAMEYAEGTSVSFMLHEREDGKPQAVDVRPIGGPPSAGPDRDG